MVGALSCRVLGHAGWLVTPASVCSVMLGAHAQSQQVLGHSGYPITACGQSHGLLCQGQY